ncbi:nose resistant to fluoxetine protein 6 isoform X2 [Rhipicephalus microplus]|uniref:nose resistant to fluoxetine protein 6 isoform X2 n=1 Tax=Rhipicephalus microplus TaxID=6941 RepID=UPI0018897CFC|nr:nose resistant to fluoxetine protein 6-like isoform X2 [Rhipicephalus microplus]
MVRSCLCRGVFAAIVMPAALTVALVTRCARAIDIRPVLEEDTASLLGNRTFTHRYLVPSGDGTNGGGNISHDEASVLELWQTYDKGLRGQVDNLLRQALPYLLEIGDVGIDIRCAQSLLKIVFGLRKLEKWAFKLLDSIGRPPSGILDVTMSDYGDYDQCLEVVSLTRSGDEDFRGQHCNIQVEHPHIPALTKHAIARLPQILKEDSVYKDVLLTYTRLQTSIAVRVGICVPSTCSKDDVFKMLNPAVANLKLGVSVAECETKGIITLTEEQLVAICMFGLLGTVLLLGTLLEIVLNIIERPSFCESFRKKADKSVLATFGVFRNLKQLLTTEDVPSAMQCLHGIRVITMFWVVLSQTYLNVEFQAVRGLKFLIPAVESLFFQVIVNGLLAVDTFFFLSGLLLAMNVIRSLDKKNVKKQTLGIFLYRYLRLTPGCMMLLCFFTLVPLLGSGPIWKEKILPEVDACRRNWWAVLLNVNNFVHSERMCLPSLWYISADWQLHCALFLIVFLLMRKPAFGGMAAFAAIIIFGVIIGVQTTLSGYPPTMLPLYAERSRVMAMVQDVVMRPYTHAGPFTVGMCTAFLIFKYPTTRITKVVQVALWLSSTLCMVLSLFTTWKWNRNVEATDLETLIYSSLHRTGWALGLAWTVYACLTDRCTLVNRVLSWKAWLPLSRLTYGVYLAHPVVMDFQMWTIRERIFGSHLSMLYLFSGNLAISMGMAVIFYLAFEAPFRRLGKDFIEKLLGCNLRAAVPTAMLPHVNDSHCSNSSNNTIKKGESCRNTVTANSTLDMPVRNGDVPQEKIGDASVHL